MIGKHPTIALTPCSRVRCERELGNARAALAEAYAREAKLVRRFEAMIDAPDQRHDVVLANEVNDVLEARDWAVARLGEWSA